MKKTIKIVQTPVTIDFDNDRYYMILTELTEEGIPIHSYSVQIPSANRYDKFFEFQYYLPTVN